MTNYDDLAHAKELIEDERQRQNRIWTTYPKPLPLWLSLIMEEVGECARAVNENKPADFALN